jgi:putative oxidoreductase
MNETLPGRAARMGLRLAALLAFLPPLLTRLVIGHAYFLTGGGKLENFERTVAFFTDLGIPLPELNAAFVARLEYYGGIALILGLGTRLVAGLLSTTMVVALLTADREMFVSALLGRGEAGLTDVTAFVFLLFLVWLVVYGPGWLSVDRVITPRLGITPAPGSAPPPSAKTPAAAAGGAAD